MKGRWRVEPRGRAARGSRGSCCAATSTRPCSGTGRCSSSPRRSRGAALGPDILGEPPDYERCSRGCAREPPAREVGDALLDQRLVAGIGNIWKAEALWEARVSPWRRLADVDDDELRAVLEAAHRLMRTASRGARPRAPRLPPRRPRLPPLRRRSIRSRAAGRARAHRVLVSRLPGRRASRAAVVRRVCDALAAPLRHAPPLLPRRVRRLHAGPRGRRRPAVRLRGARLVRPADAVRVPAARARLRRGARRPALRADDVRDAVADLQREPAARIFARAHEGDVARRAARALYRSVLVPLLVRTAEGCGGFDWDDAAFDRAYEELEESLFGEGHAYGAVAPLVGISCGTQIELGDGIRVRAAATGELAAMWPEATGLLPRDFGREPDRLCVLELERLARERGATRRPTRPASSPTPSRRSGSPPPRPSPPGPSCSSGSTGARTGSGRCCRSRRRRRPASRRGSTRSAPRSPRDAASAARASPTTTRSSATRSTAGSCRSSRPSRSAPSSSATRSTPRSATATAAWAAGMRGAALLGETAEERADLVERFREPTPDLMRRLLVAVLLHGDRAALLRELDDALLGLRARPARVASCARADTDQPRHS